MEAWHYSIRKHLYDYDSVIDKQRQRIYTKRDEILKSKINVLEEIKKFIPNIVEKLVNTYTTVHPWNLAELSEEIAEITGIQISTQELEKFRKPEDLKDYISLKIQEQLEDKIYQLTQ
jgi:preprotein translocase subunit SecA